MEIFTHSGMVRAIQEAQEQMIKDKITAKYGRQCTKLVPFTEIFSGSKTLGSASVSPDQVYFGNVYGILNASNLGVQGLLQTYKRNVVDLACSGQVFAGYTGAMYLPIVVPSVMFECMITNAYCNFSFEGYSGRFN